jgi:hypothetical protein
MEQEMNLQLMGDPTFYAEFDRNGLLQVDARSRAFYYQTLRWMGVINADGIAARENLPALPDGLGQKYFIPMNMRELGAPQPVQPPSGGGALPAEETAATDAFAMMELTERVEALEQHRNGSTAK